MKRGVETAVRLQELLSAKIFDSLKEKQPDRLAAVQVVTGDITKVGSSPISGNKWKVRKILRKTWASVCQT